MGTTISNYIVPNEISFFFITYKHDTPSKYTREIKTEATSAYIGSMIDRECSIFYVRVCFKSWELFGIWKPWVRGIMDEDSRLDTKNRG